MKTEEEKEEKIAVSDWTSGTLAFCQITWWSTSFMMLLLIWYVFSDIVINWWTTSGLLVNTFIDEINCRLLMHSLIIVGGEKRLRDICMRIWHKIMRIIEFNKHKSHNHILFMCTWVYICNVRVYIKDDNNFVFTRPEGKEEEETRDSFNFFSFVNVVLYLFIYAGKVFYSLYKCENTNCC